MATDKDKHLDCVLNSHRTSNEPDLLDKHIEKREKVKKSLEDKYSSDLYELFNSGSYAKNTAINKKFDFDLMAPFKRKSFDTLKEMYNNVFNFLYEKYKSEAMVKKQKVSTGLKFNPDEDGDVINIDVVPGRELNDKQYESDKTLNLYVQEQYGNISGGSERIRSNVRKQIDNIKDRATKEKDSIRKVIRLLKVWRIYNSKTPKSFFLELITIKAFDNKKISGSIWDKLKAVMEFIRDNVENVSLPDPGNANNDVADTLTDNDKIILSDDMKYMLERIEENSDNIKSYFPINTKFPCKDEEEDDKGYGIKKAGVSFPPSTRFGQYGEKN